MPDDDEFYVFHSRGLVPIFNLGSGVSRLVAVEGPCSAETLEDCQALVDRQLTARPPLRPALVVVFPCQQPRVEGAGRARLRRRRRGAYP